MYRRLENVLRIGIADREASNETGRLKAFLTFILRLDCWIFPVVFHCINIEEYVTDRINENSFLSSKRIITLIFHMVFRLNIKHYLAKVSEEQTELMISLSVMFMNRMHDSKIVRARSRKISMFSLKRVRGWILAQVKYNRRL